MTPTLQYQKTGDPLEDAFSASTKANDQQRSEIVLEILGPRIAAAAVGLTDARQLRAWAKGDSHPKGATEDRLRILTRIALAVKDVFGANTAAGFVRGANPGLDDKSIAQVLSTSSPDEVERQLVGVTRNFLAS